VLLSSSICSNIPTCYLYKNSCVFILLLHSILQTFSFSIPKVEFLSFILTVEPSIMCNGYKVTLSPDLVQQLLNLLQESVLYLLTKHPFYHLTLVQFNHATKPTVFLKYLLHSVTIKPASTLVLP